MARRDGAVVPGPLGRSIAGVPYVASAPDLPSSRTSHGPRTRPSMCRRRACDPRTDALH